MSANVRLRQCGPVDPVQIGTELIQYANEFGCYYIEGMATKNFIEANIGNWDSVIEFLARIGQERKEVQVLIDLTEKTEETARPILQMQAITLKRLVDRCFDNTAYPIFDKMMEIQLNKSWELSVSIKKALSTYSTLPTESDRTEAWALLQELKYCHQFTQSLSRRCNIALNHTESIEIKKINAFLGRLRPQFETSAQGEVARTVRLVHSVSAKGMPDDEDAKSDLIDDLNAEIKELPKEIQNALDRLIYELSPPPKEGELWGRLHRYDDLTILEKALCCAVRETTEAALLQEGGPLSKDRLDEFYRSLWDVAFGPDSVDQAAWARRELPFLHDLVPHALDSMLNKLKDDEANLAEEDECSTGEIEECRSDELAAQPRIPGKKPGEPQPLLPLTFQKVKFGV